MGGWRPQADVQIFRHIPMLKHAFSLDSKSRAGQNTEFRPMVGRNAENWVAVKELEFELQ